MREAHRTTPLFPKTVFNGREFFLGFLIFLLTMVLGNSLLSTDIVFSVFLWGTNMRKAIVEVVIDLDDVADPRLRNDDKAKGFSRGLIESLMSKTELPPVVVSHRVRNVDID